MVLKNLEYLAPATVEEALALLSRAGARPLAGGTDLLIHIRAGIASPRCLVDLAGLSLSYIRVEAGVLKIGAMTTVAGLLASAAVQRNLTCLTDAGAAFGAVQTRHMATIGGNLCSAVPSADLAPPLLILDSQVRIVGQDGEKLVPLEHFFTGPKTTVLKTNEILREIQVPIPPLRTGTSFLKLGRRQAMTLAVVSAAALVSVGEDGQTAENVRVALGAVAPTPIRARQAEGILQGRKISESLIDEAASMATEEIAPISDLRATAEYRRAVSRVLVKRALSKAWRQAVEEKDHSRISRERGEYVRTIQQAIGTGQQDRRKPGDEGRIELNINGRFEQVKVKPQDLLVDVLRDQLGLTGTKKGCGTGECGACTVLVAGQPINACLMLALQAQNKEIITIEGLGTLEDLHPLQETFITYGAVQCGFCAPGMLLSARALLDQNPNPTEQDIRLAIAGNICRCTGYVKIVESIRAAAQVAAQRGDTR